MTLLSHLNELRSRLMIVSFCFILNLGICYSFSESLFDFLISPLTHVLNTLHLERRLIYTHLSEAFVTYLKISAFFGFLMTIPVLFYQMARFTLPGLYRNEKKIFLMVLFVFPLLFVLGALFAYYFIFPTAYTFFLSFERITDHHIPIVLEAKLNEYLSFVMQLVLAFGLSFELPLLVIILTYSGILTRDALIKYWRLTVVMIFVISAVITPPDIISMLGLALPLLILYGLTLWCLHYFIPMKNIHSKTV